MVYTKAVPRLSAQRDKNNVPTDIYYALHIKQNFEFYFRYFQQEPIEQSMELEKLSPDCSHSFYQNPMIKMLINTADKYIYITLK